MSEQFIEFNEVFLSLDMSEGGEMGENELANLLVSLPGELGRVADGQNELSHERVPVLEFGLLGLSEHHRLDVLEQEFMDVSGTVVGVLASGAVELHQFFQSVRVDLSSHQLLEELQGVRSGHVALQTAMQGAETHSRGEFVLHFV